MSENTLFLSNDDYDIYTIRKVIALNSHLGRILVHDAEGGYLLSFSHCPKALDSVKRQFMERLIDFTNNIWSH